MTSPADVQASFAAVVVDEWVRAGLTDAVVAPGSRSTPLLSALSADGRLRLHVVLDERSGGFLALGLGAATGRPAPVVTTSGTAAVELHPAVVEADLACVPLLAVTADRPPELHHVGAPQTVEQGGLYGASTRWSVDPGVPSEASAASWRPLASRAVAVATGGPSGPGPVHLNLPMREPLLGTPDPRLAPPRPGPGPWVERSEPAAAEVADGGAVAALAARAGGRGLIVAGAGAGDPAAVLGAAEALGWPVLADPRSGVRVRHPLVVGAADALLRCAPAAGWRPDAILRLGRPWASKVLAGWLASMAPDVVQVLVDPWGRWADPAQTAGRVVAAHPTAVCATLRRSAGASGGEARLTPWARGWRDAETAAQEAVDAALAAERPEMCEPAVARAVMAAARPGSAVVASSSMPVRDLEWYGAPRRGVRVFSNRGANGIDGVVSTAVGVALAGAPTVALIGDLAFAYDAGALLWSARRDVDLTLVVVDNNGGGIFSFLPQAAALDGGPFERLWATPHDLDLGALAGAYGVAVSVATDLDGLRAAVPAGGPGVRVVVARTDRRANVAVHDRVHAAVAAALSRGAAGAGVRWRRSPP